MSFPNFPAKHREQALFNPDDFVRYLARRGKRMEHPPIKGALFCYQNWLLNALTAKHKTTVKDRTSPSMYLLEEFNCEIGIVGGFGIGAPAAVVVLEELIAMGVNRFVSIGTAGALQPGIEVGAIVLCERAMRDEGASHHYLPPAPFAAASPRMTKYLGENLKAADIEFHQGASWTIDTPYRETVAELRKYRDEGILTVEMEAAALFAVAEYRSVEIGSLFAISDSLAELEWHPSFHHADLKYSLEKLFTAAVATLDKMT